MNNKSTAIADFDLHLGKVTEAIKTGNFATAENHVQSLCQIAPNEAALRFSLADIRLAMGNVLGAIKALEEVPSQMKSDASFLAKKEEYQRQMNEAAASASNTQIKPTPAIQFSPFRAETIVYSEMKVVIIDSILQQRYYFRHEKEGRILETNLEGSTLEEDRFGRPTRDAEVLTTIAANSNGSVLELGTSFGGGTYKLATNLKAPHKVFTVNILPEQFVGDCNLVTHLIGKQEIGSYYRQHGLANIEQFYENTLNWNIPPHVSNLSAVFIDAAHDTEAVFQDSKLTWERLAPGGYMIWHDFSPLFRGKYDWINAVMAGVEKFMNYAKIDREIVNLRNSWMGVLRKP